MNGSSARPRPRIAVAGGSGFIGRHVVSALENAGYRVRILSRRPDPALARPSVELCALDVGAGSLPASALAGCDAVVNLIGIKAPRGDNDFQRAHVAAVDHLIEAATAAGIERFVHVSVAQADDASGPYARTKRAGEDRAAVSGLAVTVLRPGLVVGPGDDALRNLIRMVRLAPVVPVPRGATGPLPAVDVLDVARAVVATLAQPSTHGARIDLVGPESLSLRELVHRVARALELRTFAPPLPDGLARLGALVMERVHGDPPLTRSQLRMLTRGLPGDPDATPAALGFTPRHLTPARIRECANGLPDRLPSLRLVSGPEHRAWLDRHRAALPGGALGLAALVVAAMLAMLTLPAFVPDVWRRMALIDGGFALLLLLGPGRDAWRRLLRPRLGAVALGLAGAAVLYLAADGFMAGLRIVWPDVAQQAQAVYDWNETAPWGLRLALLVPIVFGEDLLWRGAVTMPLAARWGAAPGVLAAGFAFALAHLTSGPPLLVFAAFAMGTLWSALAVRGRSLVPVIVSHLAWDLMVMFIRPL